MIFGLRVHGNSKLNAVEVLAHDRTGSKGRSKQRFSSRVASWVVDLAHVGLPITAL